MATTDRPSARSTLVDSNVLLDLVLEDPAWGDWSAAALAAARDDGALVINPIVYAEVAAAFSTIETLDVMLAPDDARREPVPWEAAFLAGRAHVEYRRRGGARRATLPDFFIGAHAAVAGHRLLTRDPRRYRTYFPRLEIIAPS